MFCVTLHIFTLLTSTAFVPTLCSTKNTGNIQKTPPNKCLSSGSLRRDFYCQMLSTAVPEKNPRSESYFRPTFWSWDKLQQGSICIRKFVPWRQPLISTFPAGKKGFSPRGGMKLRLYRCLMICWKAFRAFYLRFCGGEEIFTG